MIQQVSINIEIKVERVVDFLLLHRRWFDTPALKLLLSLVSDIENLFYWASKLMLLIVIVCASCDSHVLQAACFFVSILQILVMDAFLGYRFLNPVELLAEAPFVQVSRPWHQSLQPSCSMGSSFRGSPVWSKCN